MLLAQFFVNLFCRLEQRLQYLAGLIAGYHQRARGAFLSGCASFRAFDAKDTVVEADVGEAIDKNDRHVRFSPLFQICLFSRSLRPCAVGNIEHAGLTSPLHAISIFAQKEHATTWV